MIAKSVRISHGCFELNGRVYSLEKNNNGHHLHGGNSGFSHRPWSGRVLSQEPPSIELTLESRDGDQGYPGNLSVSVTYTCHDQELVIEYSATTTKDTIVNLTNHSYFSLSDSDDDLTLTTTATCKLELLDQIPTGRLLKHQPSFLIDKHYDDYLIFTDKQQQQVTVSSKSTGITLEMTTTEPGFQLYTAVTCLIQANL